MRTFGRLIMLGMVLLATAVIAPGAAGAADWPNWRGPTLNGASDAKNLPDTIDPAKPKWVTELPGHSNGTAIVGGERIFVTAMENGSSKLMALCLSKADGKILWKKDIAEGTAKNKLNNLATPSPVTDGKIVVFFFGTGDMVAFDVDGKELWKRNLQADYGRFNMQWIFGSSPLLYKGRLYMMVLHRNVTEKNWGEVPAGEKLAESYVMAMDPATGKNLWRVVRPTDAKVESQESYATAIPWERPDGMTILIAGGDYISCHNPETGAEIWRAGGWNPNKTKDWRLVPSAVTFEGLVYACPPKKGLLRAYKEGGKGDVTATHTAWTSDTLTSDVAVPLIYNGEMFVLDGDWKKTLWRVDPRTGTIKDSVKFESRNVMRGSPTAGDGKIFLTNEAGDVWIVSAADLKVLCKVSLGTDFGPTRCSVSMTDGMIFVRTGNKLWAFGK